jgi:hypothetical protein
MSELKNEICKLLKCRLESSSLILLPNVYKSNQKRLKIIWLLLSIFSASWCGWFMSRSIMDYFSYDVISKTEVRYETNLLLPVITICNLNALTTDYARDLIKSRINTSYPSMSSQFMVYNRIKYNISKNLSDPYFFGKRLDEFIISCQFGTKDCNLVEDFEHIYNVDYGNCYRFNSGKNINGKDVNLKYVSPIKGHLNIELWIGQSQNNYNPYSIDNGYIIFINNETSDTSLTNGITISPGFTTNITPEKLTIKKKQQPYSNCIDNLDTIDSYDSLTYKKLFAYNRNQKYHSSNCYSMCIQKYLGDVCSCQTRYLDLVYYDEMKICYLNESLIDQEIECINTNFEKIIENSKYYFPECDCPIECEYNYYKYTISIAEYPTRQYSAYLMNSTLVKSIINKTHTLNDSMELYELLKKSVARVRIHYGESMQTFITEYAKTQLADLISSVGGILGLFLGLSFLSFIEIFDLLIQIFYVFIKHVKINNNSKKMIQKINIINVQSINK